jgi:hypothetical protein
MRSPRDDAREMPIVEIARPPGDFGQMPREVHHMLAGAAADFDHVPGFSNQDALQHRPDRLMIAVKCRRVETAVGLNWPAIPAELNDIVSHDILRICWHQTSAGGKGPSDLARHGANRKA